MAGRGHLTTNSRSTYGASQEQSLVDRASYGSDTVCETCEYPIDDDYNQFRAFPDALNGIRVENVPLQIRGTDWKRDGCQRCMDELVHMFAVDWLKNQGSMEDVACLIAEYLGLDLPRKVTT